MLPYYHGGLLAVQYLAYAVHLGKRDNDVNGYQRDSYDDIQPKDDGAHRGREISEIFRQNGHKKSREQQRRHAYTALYHPAFVVFSDESVYLGYY